MIQCQGCGSEHVQKLSVVYDGGLSDINAREAGVGLGIGAGGLGLGVGSSKIKGSHQSRLSQKAAPPEKKKVVKHLLFWILGISFVPVAVLAILGWESNVARFLVVWSYIGAGAAHVLSDIRYNLKVYPGLFSRWNASFFCHKCGVVFEVPSAHSPSGSSVLGTST